MKNFQQNKVAMKIALSFMLGSALFLSACSDSTNYSAKDMKDTEKKDIDYYKNNPDEAFEKIKWCMNQVGERFNEGKITTLDDIDESNCISVRLVLSLGRGLDDETFKKYNEEYNKIEKEMAKKYGNIILSIF